MKKMEIISRIAAHLDAVPADTELLCVFSFSALAETDQKTQTSTNLLGFRTTYEMLGYVDEMAKLVHDNVNSRERKE